MAEMIKLTTPLTDEDVMKLKAGDVVSISGVIYTLQYISESDSDNSRN